MPSSTHDDGSAAKADAPRGVEEHKPSDGRRRRSQFDVERNSSTVDDSSTSPCKGLFSLSSEESITPPSSPFDHLIAANEEKIPEGDASAIQNQDGGDDEVGESLWRCFVGLVGASVTTGMLGCLLLALLTDLPWCGGGERAASTSSSTKATRVGDAGTSSTRRRLFAGDIIGWLNHCVIPPRDTVLVLRLLLFFHQFQRGHR